MLSDLDRGRIGARSGMIASVLFVAVFFVEGYVRRDYRPIAMYISELSVGPYGWIQRVNFAVLGLLFLLFANGVPAEFPSGKASKAGPVLLAIIGVSLFASGFFVTDPGGIQTTWHGVLHGMFGALVFSLAPVTCFLFVRRFREEPTWRPLTRWTLFVGVMIVFWVVLMKIGQIEAGRLRALEGLLQRMGLVTFLAWTFIFARRLSRLHSKQSLKRS
jgi:hypothetical protein